MLLQDRCATYTTKIQSCNKVHACNIKDMQHKGYAKLKTCNIKDIQHKGHAQRTNEITKLYRITYCAYVQMYNFIEMPLVSVFCWFLRSDGQSVMKHLDTHTHHGSPNYILTTSPGVLLLIVKTFTQYFELLLMLVLNIVLNLDSAADCSQLCVTD